MLWQATGWSKDWNSMLLRLDSFEIIPEYSKYKGKYLVREGEEKMTKKREKKILSSYPLREI